MHEFGERLERQAQWQKSRRSLSWPEKVRQAEAIRDAVKALRATKTDVPPSATASVALADNSIPSTGYS
jgi:hypothetical protein